jgi:pimeloyl-ACP methyl ester carboxylesterase
VIRDHRVDTSRGPFRCLTSGAGWPLLLIHGFPLTADMWRPQLERCAPGWRYVAPDLRGFGGSPAGTIRPGMDDYAADLEAIMDALEMERAVIGGLSMGGYVTLALQRRAPERFAGIILADTKAEADTAQGREARREMSALVRAKGVGAIADRMMPRLLSRGSQDDAELSSRVRALIERNTVEGVDLALHALRDREDSTPDLPRISLPALVVVGEEDVLTPPADSQRMQAALVRSQLVVLPGAGHLSNLEAPEPFSAALADFLTSSL